MLFRCKEIEFVFMGRTIYEHSRQTVTGLIFMHIFIEGRPLCQTQLW